ncbi:MAG: MFS transporter [bacterium]|nr:MFS transporter [bacterium]
MTDYTHTCDIHTNTNMEDTYINKNNTASKLSVPMKLGYGAGDFAINLSIGMASFYLLYYFTDVFAIGSFAAGIIIFSTKIAQSIMSPAVGTMSDRTNTRWGKKRPYLLFFSFPLGMLLTLLFFSPPIDGVLRIIYCALILLLYFLTLSFIIVPYMSLAAVLTQNTDERSSISGYRMIFAVLGTFIAAGLTSKIVALFSSEAAGFRTIVFIYGLVVVFVLLLTFMSVKEKSGPLKASVEKQSFKKNIKILLANKPFLILATATFLIATAVNILGTVAIFYVKYNLNAQGLLPYALLSLLLAAALASPVFVYISNKKSKKFAFTSGMLILCVSLTLVYFFGEIDPKLTIVFFTLAGIGMSTMYLCPWSMVPDTVEYTKWKTGLNKEGMLYGWFMVFFNLSGAFARLTPGVLLDFCGYIPNTEQSDTALLGIRLLASLIPAFLILAGIAVLKFYPIDSKMHKAMIDDIIINAPSTAGDAPLAGGSGVVDK